MEKKRIIRVTGTGLLRLKPDLCCVNLNLSGVEKDYAAALERAAKDSAALGAAIASLDFSREDLKTLDFAVDAEYESVQDDKGRWRQEFKGYRFRQNLKLEFPVDNALLGRALAALAAAPVDPEFHLSYGLRDREAAKADLIEAAVADALRKAEKLAAAAGVKLGALLRMDYAMAEPVLESRPMAKAMLRGSNDAAVESFAMDINPEDIRAEDTVTITWEMD